MKFKKLFSALAVASAFVAGGAQAAPITVNVGTFDPTPAAGTNGITALANLGLNWIATSNYTDTNGSGTLNAGDLVTDSGAGSVSYLSPVTNAALFGAEANEGNGFTHNMLFDYSNLAGVVAVNDGAGGIGAFYNSGTINVWGDHDVDGIKDTLLMTLGVIGSSGTVGNFSLYTKVLTAADDVFFYNGVTDFADMLLALNVIVGEADFNVDPLIPTAAGGSPLTWTRTTDLNGNLQFNVPEPGALALLGLGLFGLGAVRRNKKSA